jgi:hypothetical protein
MKEVDKITAAREESRILSSFIDWLGENGYAICTLQKSGYSKGSDLYEIWRHKRNSHEEMLADYFEIDLDKVEEERGALLESLQQ